MTTLDGRNDGALRSSTLNGSSAIFWPKRQVARLGAGQVETRWGRVEGWSFRRAESTLVLQSVTTMRLTGPRLPSGAPTLGSVGRAPGRWDLSGRPSVKDREDVRDTSCRLVGTSRRILRDDSRAGTANGQTH